MTATGTTDKPRRGKRYTQRMRKAQTPVDKLHAEYEYLRSTLRRAVPGTTDPQVVQLTRFIKDVRTFFQQQIENPIHTERSA